MRKLIVFLLSAVSACGAATLPPVSATYSISLTWQAPAVSPDPVASYNVYKQSTGSFLLLGNTTSLTYDDTAVLSPQTYSYYVKSADAAGVESDPSNTVTLTIPFEPFAPVMGAPKAQ